VKSLSSADLNHDADPGLRVLSDEEFDLVSGGWGLPSWRSIARVATYTVAGAAVGAWAGGLPGAVGGGAAGLTVGIVQENTHEAGSPDPERTTG